MAPTASQCCQPLGAISASGANLMFQPAQGGGKAVGSEMCQGALLPHGYPALVTPLPEGTSGCHGNLINAVVGVQGFGPSSRTADSPLPVNAGTITSCPSELTIPSKPGTPVVMEVGGIEPPSEMTCADFIQPYLNLCLLSGCQAVSERFWLQAFSCRDCVIVPWAGGLQVAIAPDSFYCTLPTNNLAPAKQWKSTALS